MENSKPQVGSVVLSIAGRDKGKHFVILNIVDEQYALIADGDMRKVANPKLKKVKHLEAKDVFLPMVLERMDEGLKPLDFEIRNNLKALGLLTIDKSLLVDKKED